MIDNGLLISLFYHYDKVTAWKSKEMLQSVRLRVIAKTVEEGGRSKPANCLGGLAF